MGYINKTYLQKQFDNFAARIASVFAKNTEVPTKTSQLTNDSGYITGNGTAKTISDVLPISKGGTGKTTGADAANALINSLSNGSATPTDADYYVSQYVSGGTTTTTYHRRPMSALWAYIKEKISSVLGLTASSYGGNAATATKVNGHTVESDVPASAKFTDTVYTHPTTSGNKHIPSGGSSGQILRWSADGTAVWGADNNTTYGVATQTANGLQSAADKKKLDGIEEGAEVNVQSDWNATDSTSDAFIKNKPTIPAAVAVKGNAESSYRTGNVNITPANIGLGSVNNTADADKTVKSAGTCTGNSATATKLSTARTIDGVDFDGSAAISHYGTCSTAAATAAKVVALTGFKLVTGASVKVKFTVTNTASNPTLNVNSTGAKAIYYRGSAITAGYLAANRTYEFVYNGTQWDLIGDIDTDTKYNNATTSNPGLMSASDKAKLNGIDSGALSTGSTRIFRGIMESYGTEYGNYPILYCDDENFKSTGLRDGDIFIIKLDPSCDEIDGVDYMYASINGTVELIEFDLVYTIKGYEYEKLTSSFFFSARYDETVMMSVDFTNNRIVLLSQYINLDLGSYDYSTAASHYWVKRNAPRKISEGSVTSNTITLSSFEPDSSYLLVTKANTVSTGKIYGAYSVLIVTPASNVFGTVANTNAQVAKTTNTGLTLTMVADGTVTIKVSSTYEVFYELYKL